MTEFGGIENTFIEAQQGCETATTWEDYTRFFDSLFDAYTTLTRGGEEDELDELPRDVARELLNGEKYLINIGKLFEDYTLSTIDTHLRTGITDGAELFEFSSNPGHIEADNNTHPFQKLCEVIGISPEQVERIVYEVNKYPILPEALRNWEKE